MMIGSLKLDKDNQQLKLREVNIQDENEHIDLEINRKAHLNSSVQNNERPLVFKQKEIKFKIIMKQNGDTP